MSKQAFILTDMDKYDFMRLALEQARLSADEGEVPVGAVVVRNGEVVSYGTLLLLTLDKQYDKLERFFDFYKGMELPTKLADLEIEVDELDPVLELAVQRYDLDVVPYEITPAMIKDAILELEEYNKKRA